MKGNGTECNGLKRGSPVKCRAYSLPQTAFQSFPVMMFHLCLEKDTIEILDIPVSPGGGSRPFRTKRQLRICRFAMRNNLSSLSLGAAVAVFATVAVLFSLQSAGAQEAASCAGSCKSVPVWNPVCTGSEIRHGHMLAHYKHDTDPEW